MKVAFNGTNLIPSFGAVIPVKKIIYNENRPRQIRMDEFLLQNDSQADTDQLNGLDEKVAQLLCRILTRNDKIKNGTEKEAHNSMIRTTLAYYDKDYGIPTKPVDSDKSRALASQIGLGEKRYILTGKEAQRREDAGKRIGGARAMVRDYNAHSGVVRYSKNDYGDVVNEILCNPDFRLRTEYKNPLGLVIYADVNDVPRKGRPRDSKKEITINAIKFERMEYGE